MREILSPIRTNKHRVKSVFYRNRESIYKVSTDHIVERRRAYKNNLAMKLKRKKGERYTFCNTFNYYLRFIITHPI